MTAPLRSLLLLAWLALPSAVFAQRLDEYLQAALVVIEPDRVRLQINLMPGVAVADEVLAESTATATAPSQRRKQQPMPRL